MTKEEAIYKILSEDEDLQEKVGKRIYPLVAPYGIKTFPYIVYSQSSRAQAGTKDGEERTLIVAVSVVSKQYKEAHDIAALMEDVFQADDAVEIADEADMEYPEFESESEMYDTATDSFMVKTEISYEYSI